MLNFFTDLDFLLSQLSGIENKNLLCVYRNPIEPPKPCTGELVFELLGYDLVDERSAAKKSA
jgi:hypothetical protein